MRKNWRDYFRLGASDPEPTEEQAEPEVLEETPDDPEPYKAITAQLPGNTGPSGILDEHSQTWVFVKRWAKEELDKIREKNDTISLNMEKTSANRGKIKMLKDLIKLPETIMKQAEKDALKFKNQ